MENRITLCAFADEADKMIVNQIKALRENDMSLLEIRGVDGENISDISLEKAREVKDKLDSNGLVTWSVGSPIGKIMIVDDFSAHLDKFKHTLEIANILNAENLRMFSFYIPENEKAENYKNQVIDYLGQMSEIAKPYNVNLCHENEKGIYGDIPERCLDIHKALPTLKGIFDPANYVQCGVDTLKAWDMLKDYIFYMHIKDSQKNGFVVPAGCGDGNVKEVVEKYIQKGGNNFTLEPHLTVFDGLNSLEKEGEKSAVDSFKYSSNIEAFDVAANTFKKLLGEI